MNSQQPEPLQKNKTLKPIPPSSSPESPREIDESIETKSASLIQTTTASTKEEEEQQQKAQKLFLKKKNGVDAAESRLPQ